MRILISDSQDRVTVPLLGGRDRHVSVTYVDLTCSMRKALSTRILLLLNQIASTPRCPVGYRLVAPNRCGINSMPIPTRSTIRNFEKSPCSMTRLPVPVVVDIVDSSYLG